MSLGCGLSQVRLDKDPEKEGDETRRDVCKTNRASGWEEPKDERPKDEGPPETPEGRNSCGNQ